MMMMMERNAGIEENAQEDFEEFEHGAMSPTDMSYSNKQGENERSHYFHADNENELGISLKQGEEFKANQSVQPKIDFVTETFAKFGLSMNM